MIVIIKNNNNIIVSQLGVGSELPAHLGQFAPQLAACSLKRLGQRLGTCDLGVALQRRERPAAASISAIVFARAADATGGTAHTSTVVVVPFAVATLRTAYVAGSDDTQESAPGAP